MLLTLKWEGAARFPPFNSFNPLSLSERKERRFPYLHLSLSLTCNASIWSRRKIMNEARQKRGGAIWRSHVPDLVSSGRSAWTSELITILVPNLFSFYISPTSYPLTNAPSSIEFIWHFKNDWVVVTGAVLRWRISTLSHAVKFHWSQRNGDPNLFSRLLLFFFSFSFILPSPHSTRNVCQAMIDLDHSIAKISYTCSIHIQPA